VWAVTSSGLSVWYSRVGR